MTKVKKTLIIFCFFVCVIVCGGFLVLFPPLPLIPEIGRNLSGNFEEAEDTFKNRVAKNFLIGTKNSELVENLANQGFEVTILAKSDFSASFTKAVFPCFLRWSIFWTVDENENIKTINASYGDAGCL